MTMLDRMRRHKGWLKWSLALVVLAFIIFYIPAFLQNDQGARLTDAVASVDGRTITVEEFRRTYQSQLQVYRNAYGGNMSEQMLKQLGLDQQILQQMVDEQASMAEAERQGLDVSDAEVAQRIFSIPAFQQNGQFVGQAAYAGILRMQRPPMTPEEFEASLRRSMVIEKLRGALTSWVTVPDKDVAQEFQRRNEKVKVDLVSFSVDKLRSEVSVTDAELPPYFDAHKESYRIGERRKVKYLLVDVDALRASTTVSTREVERSYNDNIELYTTPEQIRASHILFKSDAKNDAEVKAKAEQVLKEVKAGGDFAALATKYSQDETSAKNGGDLDYFGKGKMVPEFDAVAFELQPGQTSDLVKTQFGYHIIKLTDKKPATMKAIDEVRAQITEQLTWERAQSRAADMAAAMEKEITSPATLEKVAKERGLKLQESGYFARDEPILGLGPSPSAAAETFDLNPGQVSGAVRVSRGFAFLTVVDKQAPRLPTLDEVKDRVREDVTKQKARELARQKAAAVAATLKAAADFAKAAKTAGVEVRTTELVARETAWPETGVSQAIDEAAFSLPTGSVSGPIDADNAVAIIRVVEHRSPTPSEFEAEKARLKEELLNDRRGRFFSAYMVKAKQKMKIAVDRENLQRVIG